MAILLLVIRLLNPVPVIAALPRPHEINRRLRKLAVYAVPQSAIVLLGVWFLIWASYGFRFALFNPAISDQKEPTPFFQGPGVLNAIGKFVEQKHLLPQAFLFSYAYMLHRIQGGNPAFLNGEFSMRGWLRFLSVLCGGQNAPGTVSAPGSCRGRSLVLSKSRSLPAG